MSTEDRFGTRVKKRREALGMSQAHVANVLNMLYGFKWHQTTVAKTENGTVRPLSLNEAAAVAAVLDQPLTELLDDAHPDTDTSAQFASALREVDNMRAMLDKRAEQLRQAFENRTAPEGIPNDGQHKEAT